MKISEKYRQLKKIWIENSNNGKMKDDNNPIFIFALTDTDLLKKIVKGELDVTQLALMELENRNCGIKTYTSFGKDGRRIRVTIPD